MRGNRRSHAMRRLMRRLPGNTTTTHFVRRRPNYAHCPITGQKLNGVPRLRPAQLSKLTKTQRRPSRPYGGKISHTALVHAIQQSVLKEYHQE